jgi:hypothetical protein
MNPMRYSLRTLLIVMMLAGPLCLFGWNAYLTWRARQEAIAARQIPIARFPIASVQLGLVSIPATFDSITTTVDPITGTIVGTDGQPLDPEIEAELRRINDELVRTQERHNGEPDRYEPTISRSGPP